MANFHLALSMRDVFYFEVPLLELEINDYLISSDDKIFDLVKKIPTESGLGLSLDKETISKFQYVQGTEYKW
jgi:L-alanine-DL-glutamate epimerase-like enolase superfamily enzyme